MAAADNTNLQNQSNTEMLIERVPRTRAQTDIVDKQNESYLDTPPRSQLQERYRTSKKGKLKVRSMREPKEICSLRAKKGRTSRARRVKSMRDGNKFLSVDEYSLIPQTVKRSRIVNEMVETERSYTATLEQLIQHLASFLTLDEKDKDIFPETECRTIHSNCGIILDLSKVLLEMLAPRAEIFDQETCIGDIFLQLADYMKVYTFYIEAYQPFIAQFVTFWQKYKDTPICENISTPSQFMAFESCLIVPVQRIPRYQLLLTNFVQNTPETHPDFPSLNQALEKISAVATYVNHKQTIYDGIQQVLKLHKRFGRQLTDNTGVSEFVRSHRRFVKQGDFFMTKGTKVRTVRVYLLNDILLVGNVNEHGEPGTKLHQLVCLWLVKEVHSDDESFTISLHEEDNVVLSIQATEKEQKVSWVQVIEETLTTLMSAFMKGSDVEAQKIHITEDVRWNKPLIPPEIAQALAADQAVKRSGSAVVSLSSETSTKENSPKEKKGSTIKLPVSLHIPSNISLHSLDPDHKNEAVSTNTKKSNTSFRLQKSNTSEKIIGQLFIRILEARHLNLKSEQTANAFVRLQLKDKQCITSVAKKSVHPVWTEKNEFIL